MITKLPQGFKAAILSRLRDPKMKKAYGYLCLGPTEMCCLGHIVAAVGKGFREKPDPDGYYRTTAAGQAHMPRTEDLPDAVYKSLQSYISEGDRPVQAMTFLTEHNDGDSRREEWSLLQAADWIEANL